MGISVGYLSEKFFSDIRNGYSSDSNTLKLCQILSQIQLDLSLATTLEEPWKDLYFEGRFSLFSGLLSFRVKHTSTIVLVNK